MCDSNRRNRAGATTLKEKGVGVFSPSDDAGSDVPEGSAAGTQAQTHRLKNYIGGAYANTATSFYGSS
eukprot:5752028-Pyramimonas_sp.AAC.1